MDEIICQYKGVKRGDLFYCFQAGVAYQIDMRRHVPYDEDYFKKYLGYENTDIGQKLNQARLEAVQPWARGLRHIDIGIGCGSFLKLLALNGIDASGYDVNPVSIAWLKDFKVWADPYQTAQKYFCWSFWDSLEHIADPGKLLEKIPIGSFVFISLPIFDWLEDVKESKHYRPDEHYYYFTQSGFLKWMKARNFKLAKIMNFETKLGRENIRTYQFERVGKIKDTRKLEELLIDFLGIRRREKVLV